MNRLETISKILSAKFVASSLEQQRKASIVACELAFHSINLEIPYVLESLEQLRLDGKLTQERIAELNELSTQYDEKYFTIEDKAEDGLGLQAESIRLFSYARAIAALSLAGEEDILVSATECIYEASMVFDNSSDFFTKIEETLAT